MWLVYSVVRLVAAVIAGRPTRAVWLRGLSVIRALVRRFTTGAFFILRASAPPGYVVEDRPLFIRPESYGQVIVAGLVMLAVLLILVELMQQWNADNG